MFVMGLSTLETFAIWAVFGVAWLGLAYAVFLRSQILREDKGTEKMQEVWEGRRTYSKEAIDRKEKEMWGTSKKRFREILEQIGYRE